VVAPAIGANTSIVTRAEHSTARRRGRGIADKIPESTAPGAGSDRRYPIAVAAADSRFPPTAATAASSAGLYSSGTVVTCR